MAEKTGKRVSTWMLKRFSEKRNFKWKRVRTVVKKKPDKKEFKQAQKEIEELKIQQKTGKIELYFFDEAGFSLEPNSSLCLATYW